MISSSPLDAIVNPKGSPGPSSWIVQEGRAFDSWGVPTVIAVVAVLVYLTSIANGFAFDDILIIVENPLAHDFSDVLRIWLTPYWPGPEALTRGLYRPLTIFLFALQWGIGGGSPLPFHVLNVLLHAAASVLVYHLIRQFVVRRCAFWASVLFAVHPVHVEAVANAVGQAELVSTCLVLFAAVLHMRRPMEGEVAAHHRRLIAGAFLLGLFAKENAIVLPSLLLVLDVAQGRVRRVGYLRSVARLGILLAGVMSIYLVLRALILGGGLSGDAAVDLQFLRDPSTRILTALSVWPEYARLLVAPLHLSAMYDPDTIVPLHSFTFSVLAGFTLLLFLVVTTLLPSAWPSIGLSSAWFLITIFLVSNLMIPIGTVLGERTLYLPSVALAIGVGFGLQWALNREIAHRRLRPTVTWAFTIVLVAFGLRAALRNPVWSNNEVLFETTFRDHPENFRAQWFHAQRMAAKGDSTGSVHHWERALEIYPGHTGFLTDYARFLLATGNLGEADEMVARALRIRPDVADGLFVQGLIDVALNREVQANERASRLAELGFTGMANTLVDSLNASQRRTIR